MNRHPNRVTGFATALLLLLTCNAALAGSLTVPNTFTAGTPAVAADVNANFGAVKSAVDDNNSRITALEAALATLQNTVSAQATTISDLQTTITTQAATITDLQTAINDHESRIATLETQVSGVNNSQVMALNPYLTVDTVSDPRGPLIRFSGVNLQVVNGLGSTATANGLGNFIVGYDEVNTSGIGRCTIGWYLAGGVPTDATNCALAGGTWTTTGFKTGSHYLITGMQNNYSRWGGLLAGFGNTSNYDYASVSGGSYNTASGSSASVSGGINNIASGSSASVGGGSGNIASGLNASISGGGANTAGGGAASVSGGFGNSASGGFANVSGGRANTASGTGASVCGGGNGLSTGGNTASFNYSTILGGTGKTTTTVSESLP